MAPARCHSMMASSCARIRPRTAESAHARERERSREIVVAERLLEKKQAGVRGAHDILARVPIVIPMLASAQSITSGPALCARVGALDFLPRRA